MIEIVSKTYLGTKLLLNDNELILSFALFWLTFRRQNNESARPEKQH